MEKTILQYQKSFNAIVERLKANEDVLAVMVFGSMVTGDLWEESDIDLFVILEGKESDIRNIYTTEKNIPVHIKLMTKEKFLQLHEADIRGGFIHRIFAASRLVYSKDREITSRYDIGRYYPDIDRERWNMVYLGKTIKKLSLCKKYLFNEGMYTAYTAAVKCVEEYAKFYVNLSGYMINKDAMVMALNLNDDFKKIVDNLLFNKEDTKSAICAVIDYVQEAINEKLQNSVVILLEFMGEQDSFLSAEDIKNNKLFENYEIAMEDILELLSKQNIIKKESRDYKTQNDKTIFKENVYFL